MSDADQPSDSVLGSLGIDVDSVDIPVLDDLWQAMLEVAFDPDTPVVDSSVVPVMDDSGDLPDDGSGDVDLATYDVDSSDEDAHGSHHGDDVTLDHDSAFDHHDPGTDGSAPDHGGDHHGDDHHGHEDPNWHV